ncbi:putative cytosolic iron-sulfur protein assembly protein CIAO1-like [Porphyridium purpureum]|uniref:Probable cytosolic iron-sulfur protein assembly protein CIAO1 homolog n=1 Tax=Porphyridium purpureum TaxID=35688 RepID=A0A5J4YNG7_PORPP|nr:putative cytosolic iron-sulfur protein assembly protein CIAO1-like [Porphyridium purpureum]|eukprot:POR0997..scf222_8
MRRVQEIAKAHAGIAWCLAWAPSGRMLASCGQDCALRIWAPASQQGPNDATTWSCVASLGGAETSILEDVRSRDEEQDFGDGARCVFARTLRSVQWHPDGNSLALACFDGSVVIVELRRNVVVNQQGRTVLRLHVVSELRGHDAEVKRVAYSRSGTLLATCSRDKSVWIWESALDLDYECVAVLSGHTADVKCLAWHPLRDRLLSGGYDGSMRAWQEDEDDGGDFGIVSLVAGVHATVWDLAYELPFVCLEDSGRDGDDPEHAMTTTSQTLRLASVGDEGALVIWECTEPDPLKLGAREPSWKSACMRAHAHARPIFSVDWSPAPNARIATGGGDDCIRIWRIDDGNNLEVEHEVLAAHRGEVNCVAWQPRIRDAAGDRASWSNGSSQEERQTEESHLLASCGDDGSIVLWEVAAT